MMTWQARRGRAGRALQLSQMVSQSQKQHRRRQLLPCRRKRGRGRAVRRHLLTLILLLQARRRRRRRRRRGTGKRPLKGLPSYRVLQSGGVKLKGPRARIRMLNWRGTCSGALNRRGSTEEYQLLLRRLLPLISQETRQLL